MANALLIAPLNAANFESGAAESGQVLTADGSGGATWETPAAGGSITSDYTPAGSILVSGAESAVVNGIYHINGTANGRPRYDLVDAPAGECIEWTVDGESAYWTINSDGVLMYGGDEDVATPDLVSTWWPDSGQEPVPTVATWPYFPAAYVLTADGSGDTAWEAVDADTIDSGSAAAGELLAADGSGGAAWVSPGQVFAFDGVVFTPWEFVADSGSRTITLSLTTGGNDVPDGIYFLPILVLNPDFGYGYLSVSTPSDPDTARFNDPDWPDGKISVFRHTETHVGFDIQVGNTDNAARDALIVVALPDGSMATATISIPGVV